MNTSNNIELIENYLEGKLTSAEISELENAIQNNPDMKLEFELQKNLVHRIRHNGLKGSVKEAHIRFEKRATLVKKLWIISSVAAVAALLALAWFMKSEHEHAQLKSSDNVQQENLIQAGKPDKVESVSTNPSSEKSIKDSILPVVKKPAVTLKFSTYEFSAEKGIEVKDKRSGTLISIPGGVLKDKNGNTVTGKVTLTYREFRQPSDFVLAGYPMTCKDMNFNSAGMFEIWALQKNDTLSLKNGAAAEMKFKMTKNEEGIGFYKLDLKKKTWEMISEGEHAKDRGRDSSTREPDLKSAKERIMKEAEERLKTESQSAKDLLIANPFSKSEKPNRTVVNKTNEGKVSGNYFEPEPGNIKIDSAGKTVEVFRGKLPASEILKSEEKLPANQTMNEGDEKERYAAQVVNPGHFADPLIRNLRLTGFGVFNCDQVYRIKNPVNIRATYIDEKGEQIRNLKVVNVIDKKVNGAFSFNPGNFICSTEGTMLVLFTYDNRIYFLNEEAWKKAAVIKSGEYVLPVKEITGEVHSSEDLQEILMINGKYM
jgi:hypothetical protein